MSIKTVLPRVQFFEFCDQSWLNGMLREGLLDCLNAVHRYFRPYSRLAEPVQQWARGQCVLDIASGAGEHVKQLLPADKKCSSAQFVLSDLFPDTDAYRRIQAETGGAAVQYIGKSVCAANLNGVEQRYWSIFTSFHHLPEETARRFLKSAALHADGICIAELTQRRILDLLLMPLGIPFNMFTPFFSKRCTWGKVLFSTVIPIIPCMFAFDGCVSALRSYTRDEVLALCPPELLENFEIQYRASYWPFLPLKVSALFFARKSGRAALNSLA